MAPIVSKPAQPRHKYELDISSEGISHLMTELSFFERAALEESSRKCMTSIVRCYSIFCGSIRLNPFPVSFESVALFLIQSCHKFGNTTRSIPGMLSHLKRANRSYSNEWLDARSEQRLEDVIKGLKKFDRSQPRRKLPMTHNILSDIAAVADMRSIRDFQHVTMSRVAHDALLRGTELINLKVGDLLWSEDETQVTIVIHLSKANKTGPAERVTLRDYGSSSGAAFLKDYVRIMRFQDQLMASTQPLWPTVAPSGQVMWNTSTTKAYFVGYARYLLERAGYDSSKFSGHSYRSGGATDLWASYRCRAHTIQLYGRWKSEAYRLYIRDNPQDTVEEVADAMSFFASATGLADSSADQADSNSVRHTI